MMEDIEEYPLTGNGDFRSDECVQLLKECDIVVTNPPFSLFREFVDTLMTHEKKFIILGNNNAVTYKEVFQHIKKRDVVVRGSCQRNHGVSTCTPLPKME